MSVQVVIEQECNWFILYVDGKEVDGYTSLEDAMEVAKGFSDNVVVQF